MKSEIYKKPWYFAVAAIAFVIKPIANWVVMQLFDEEIAKSFLEKSVPIFSIIPWAAFATVIIICLAKYVYQIKNRKSSPNETERAKIDVLREKMEKMVTENAEIEVIQVFDFSIKGGRDRSIKLNYLIGAADEGIDINTILQTYFHFSFPVYRKVEKVSALYQRYLREKELSQKNIAYTEFLESGKLLCDMLLSELNSIHSPDEIGEYDCEKYRVLARLMPAIANMPIGSILTDEQVEMALIKRKKTGILGAILFDGVYVFRNQSSVVKKDRIYFSFRHTKMKNTVICASINGNGETLGDDNIEEYCKTFIQHFCNE